LITAGGTGGHVYPALAVADYLRHHGMPLVWLGTRSGLEYRIIPARGYRLLTIRIAGVRGRGLLRLAWMPVQALLAVLHSMVLLMHIRPVLVLGMGGFVSGPAGVAAWLMRIPLLIHEQNAIAGFTNAVLARFATRVMEAFPGTFRTASAVVHTGNPVRSEIIAGVPLAPSSESSEALNILVLGGSQGAKALNELMPEAFARLDPQSIRIWHQCGEQHYDATHQRYHQYGVSARIDRYISAMAEAYAWAGLVVCRAGALTVSELMVAGLPSILIPYPHAVDDHQTANARYLSGNGAGILVPQARADGVSLAALMRELLGARERLAEMARKARALAMPDATELVAQQCLEVACA
jgi:UDP-N-acetylglucosamine--N-acetylmuramyl-(pentapeptide) pyrophosphoryl-undecaprenol N-acetylglucosamine transferase